MDALVKSYARYMTCREILLQSVGIVRDVTATFKDIMIEDETLSAVEHIPEAASRHTSKPGGLFGKILGKSIGQSLLILQRRS